MVSNCIQIAECRRGRFVNECFTERDKALRLDHSWVCLSGAYCQQKVNTMAGCWPNHDISKTLVGMNGALRRTFIRRVCGKEVI